MGGERERFWRDVISKSKLKIATEREDLDPQYWVGSGYEFP